MAFFSWNNQRELFPETSFIMFFMMEVDRKWIAVNLALLLSRPRKVHLFLSLTPLCTPMIRCFMTQMDTFKRWLGSQDSPEGHSYFATLSYTEGTMWYPAGGGKGVSLHHRTEVQTLYLMVNDRKFMHFLCNLSFVGPGLWFESRGWWDMPWLSFSSAHSYSLIFGQIE